MDPLAGEMARDMERVHRAIRQARVYVAGRDQSDSARALSPEVAYSPLRTLLEQSEVAAERIGDYLRDLASERGGVAAGPPPRTMRNSQKGDDLP